MLDCHFNYLLLCFHYKFTCLIYIQSFSRCLPSTHCLHMLHRRREPKARHVAIHRFELIRVDRIGLMPDSNTSIRADGLIEFLPRPKMWIRWMPREPFQVLEGTPVLDQHRTIEISKELCMEESLFRVTK